MWIHRIFKYQEILFFDSFQQFKNVKAILGSGLLQKQVAGHICRLWWLIGKESTCNAEAVGSIPGLGWSPGKGNGNPRWSSCLQNPMDRGAWWAIVHGVTKSWTWLSTHSVKLWYHHENVMFDIQYQSELHNLKTEEPKEGRGNWKIIW